MGLIVRPLFRESHQFKLDSTLGSLNSKALLSHFSTPGVSEWHLGHTSSSGCDQGAAASDSITPGFLAPFHLPPLTLCCPSVRNFPAFMPFYATTTQLASCVANPLIPFTLKGK